MSERLAPSRFPMLLVVLCAVIVAPRWGRTVEPFLRGDVNADGAVDLGDAMRELGYLFLGEGAPTCLDSADVNDDGAVDVGDPLHTLFFLFLGSVTIPAPATDCGEDPTADSLGCVFHAPCAPPPSPTSILRTSPADGEDDVSPTRETIIEFTAPIDGTTVASSSIRALSGGQVLSVRRGVSAERRRVTLFYAAPLPERSRVTVELVGDELLDETGLGTDPDGDGEAGGVGRFRFDTLGVTTVSGTSVYGRVFASELESGPAGATIDRPLAGVTITVDGKEDTLFAVTDEAGNFRLDPAPVGRFFVHINGKSAIADIPDGAYYPSVGKTWESRSGTETGVGDVFLPLVQAGTLQPVSETSDVEIGFASSIVTDFPEFEGTRITVPAGSLFADDGAPGGQVGIAPVPPDRIPGQLPPGLGFPLVITVQTDGATNFDEPAPVCFPNLPDPDTGEVLAPGEKTALWSFNHDRGAWEVVGRATVGEDGRLACTDPGVGIRAPGWHGVDPGTNGRGGGGTGGPGDGTDPGGDGDPGGNGDPGGGDDEERECTIKGAEAIRGIRSCAGAVLIGTVGELLGPLGCPLGFADAALQSGSDCLLAYFRERSCRNDIVKNVIGAGVGCLPGGGPAAAVWTCVASGFPPVCEYCRSCKTDASYCQMPEGLESCDPAGDAIDWVHELIEDLGDNLLDLLGETRRRNHKSLPVSRHINIALYEQLELFQATAAYYAAILGDEAWARVELVEFPVMRRFLEAVEQTVDATSPAGERIDVAERADLLALPRPSTISQAVVEAAIDRMDALSAGTISPEELGGDAILAANERLQLVVEVMASRGWESPVDGLLYVLSSLSEGIGAGLESRRPVAGARYRITDIATGFTIRGALGSQGAFTTLPLRVDASYVIDLVHPESFEVATAFFRSGQIGENFQIPRAPFLPSEGDDTDADGIPDEAEEILGTDAADADSDDDGILDGGELRQGLDPLEGQRGRSGVVASLAIPDPADNLEISGSLGVFLHDTGVQILNVFGGMPPRIIGGYATPRRPAGVALENRLLVVALGNGSRLEVVSLDDPAQPRLLRTLPLRRDVAHLEIVGPFAYTTSISELIVTDLTSGAELGAHDFGMGLGGHALYADDELVVVKSQGRELFLFSSIDRGFSLRRRLVMPAAAVGADDPHLVRAGNFLYLSTDSTYQVVDVANPDAPVVLTENILEQVVLGSIALDGGRFLAAVDGGGISDQVVSIFDVSDPTDSTRFLTSFEVEGVPFSLAMHHGQVYVVTRSGQLLHVINFWPADTDGVAPSVTLTTNAVEGQVEAGGLLAARATAVDDQQIHTVEFYVDDRLVLADGTFPFEYRGTAASLAEAGSITLQARAIDTGGNTATSEEVTVTIVEDLTAPRVTAPIPVPGTRLLQARSVGVLLSEPIDSDSLAADALTLLEAGSDGLFDTADDQPVTSGVVRDRPALPGVFLEFAEPLAAGDYRATLQAGIADSAGNALLTDFSWTFQTARLSTLEGTVTLEDGTPVEGATVTVRASGGAILAQVSTGALGAFSIEGLGPGPVELVVILELAEGEVLEGSAGVTVAPEGGAISVPAISVEPVSAGARPFSNISHPTVRGATAFALGDLDSDGDDDLAVCSDRVDGVVVQLRQEDGSFSFDGFYSAGMDLYSVATGDIDGDGVVDVVAGGQSAIFVFSGVGSGILGDPVSIPTGFSQSYGLGLAELTGDTLPEIIAHDGAGDSFEVFRNTDGVFELADSFRTDGRSVDRGRRGFAVADFDGDGLSDLVASSQNWIRILAGVGDGTFGDTLFSRNTGVGAVHVEDLNGDDRPDVVTHDGRDRLWLYLSPEDDPETLLGPPIAFTVPVPAIGEFAASDIDGDGRRDLLLSHTPPFETGSLVVLYRSDASVYREGPVVPVNARPSGIALGSSGGVPRAFFFPGSTSVVVEVEGRDGGFVNPDAELEGTRGAIELVLGDLDGDGVQDSAVGLRNDIRVALSSRGTERELDVQGLRALEAADLDGDGLEDLVGATSGNQVVVYPQTEDGFGVEPDLFSAGVFGLDAIELRDFDADGDLDVLASTSFSSRFLENAGSHQLALRPEIPQFGGGVPLDAADFDGDGRVDFLVPAAFQSNGLWTHGLARSVDDWEFEREDFFSTGGNLRAARFADVDVDGNLDVVAVFSLGNSLRLLVLYANADGSLGETLEREFLSLPEDLADPPSSTLFMEIADLDGDRAPELIVPGAFSSQVSVFWNAGGMFDSEQRIWVGLFPEFATIGDLTLDGRPDIAIGSGSLPIRVLTQ